MQSLLHNLPNRCIESSRFVSSTRAPLFQASSWQRTARAQPTFSARRVRTSTAQVARTAMRTRAWCENTIPCTRSRIVLRHAPALAIRSELARARASGSFICEFGRENNMSVLVQLPARPELGEWRLHRLPAILQLGDQCCRSEFLLSLQMLTESPAGLPVCTCANGQALVAGVCQSCQTLHGYQCETCSSTGCSACSPGFVLTANGQCRGSPWLAF